MTAINQKEYLKKYLSIGKKDEKKKKRKKKVPTGDGVKIIDDDIDLSQVTTLEEATDLFSTNEDAPQVVGVIDERPLHLRIDDYRKSDLWKPLGADDENSTGFRDVRNDENDINPPRHKVNLSISKSSDSRKKDKDDFSKSKNLSRRQQSSDDSPPRKRKIDDGSPPRRKQNDDRSPPRRSRRDSDSTPPRKNRRDLDDNPSRKKDYNNSPPHRTRRDSDNDSQNDHVRSPRRSRTNSDSSPPRRKQNDSSPPRKSRRNADNSPPRRKQNDDSSPPRKSKRNSDSSPPRSKHDNSPPRRTRTNSDNSPPRKKKNDDSSPLRRSRKDSDNSPPRKKQNDDSSPPRKRQNDDNSPPRRKQRNPGDSPPIKSRKDDSTPPRKSRWDNNSSPKPSSSFQPAEEPKRKLLPGDKKGKYLIPAKRQTDKMEKTLDGRNAGLQSAQELVKENAAFRKREDELFKNMSAETSGVNATTVMRDRKTGKIRDLQKEAEERREKEKVEEENKQKYSRWGRGLKQVEDYEEKLAQDLHEMNKPLARYADDEDLEKFLKEQEREGDPMLAYIKKKKKKKVIESGKPLKPQYEGEFMPTRFGIRPGYRWDGVDRSNGYEKKWFEVQNAKRAEQEEIYKWSTEDM